MSNDIKVRPMEVYLDQFGVREGTHVLEGSIPTGKAIPLNTVLPDNCGDDGWSTGAEQLAWLKATLAADSADADLHKGLTE